MLRPPGGETGRVFAPRLALPGPPILPPALFPIAAVHSAAVTMLLSLVPLVVLLAVTGGQFSWALLFLPVALALAALFTYGVALLLAAASVFFHDTIHMYQVVLLAWM